MAGFAEYEAYDGLGLADLVRRHEVTPEELPTEAMAEGDIVGEFTDQELIHFPGDPRPIIATVSARSNR
jgi:hypothetical protein